MKNFLVISCGIVLVSSPLTTNVMARSNILTGGLISLSYDFQDRRGDAGSVALEDSGSEDYQRVVISPLIQIVSSSQRDRFELRAEPGIRYDLDESETDWDSNFSVAAERSISRAWQINGSNSFFRSDYNNTAGDVEAVEPELSPDLGRRRYWRNTLNFESNYDYSEDSLFRVGADWIVLRNDDSDSEVNDYDRYSLTLRNEHRYTARWKTIADFTTVRGDYDESDPAVLSEDLFEYNLELGIENNTIAQNPLSITYNYIGVRYDESLQNYSDIHELRFSWRRDISPQIYTILGAGPSYEKTEGRDANWGGNGVAEVNYQIRQGYYRFILEKGYEPENFSGTDDQAIVDFWDARFYLNRQLSRVLSVDGLLGYRYEDRTEQVAGTLSDEINEDRFTVEIGLGYLVSQHYSARVSYSFISQDSDVQADNYDDHRVLVSLSWEQDLLRW